jgi:hypothetical protein
MNEQIFAPLKLHFEFLPETLDIMQEDESQRAAALAQLVPSMVDPMFEIAAEVLGYELTDEQWALWRSIQGEKKKQADAMAEAARQAAEAKPDTGNINQPPEGTTQDGPGQEKPTPAEEDMQKWLRKSIKALANGKSAAVDFESLYIADEAKRRIYLRLGRCTTADEVKAIFALDWNFPTTLAESQIALARELSRANDLMEHVNGNHKSIVKTLWTCWTCGIIPGHEHETEEEAQKCIDEHTNGKGWITTASGAHVLMGEEGDEGGDGGGGSDGGSERGGGGNEHVGDSYGSPVYKINDASKLMDDSSVIGVSINGKNKGTILASPKRIPHSELVKTFDQSDSFDNYVRLENLGHNTLRADVLSSGLSDVWSEEGGESKAVDHIYKATSRLVSAGLPSSTKLIIKGLDKTIHTTAKSILIGLYGNGSHASN